MSFTVYHIKRHMISICVTTGNVNLDHLLTLVSVWFPHFCSFVINKYFVSDTLRLFKCTVSQKIFIYKFYDPDKTFKALRQKKQNKNKT